MKIKIAIEFEVQPVDDDEDFTEEVARSAASIAEPEAPLHPKEP